MSSLTVELEDPSGDGVAKWGAYEFWRIPAAFVPDGNGDGLDNMFAAALRAVLPPNWEWSAP